MENSFLLKGTWPHSVPSLTPQRGTSRSLVIALRAVPLNPHASSQAGQPAQSEDEEEKENEAKVAANWVFFFVAQVVLLRRRRRSPALVGGGAC